MVQAETPLTEAELTALWRTEQVLHGQLDEQTLGFARLAVCECAEEVQKLAARVQRERIE